MAGRPRNRMSPAQRAKQFIPFAALKGLPEALEQKEREMVSEMERLKETEVGLSEEETGEAELNSMDFV